MEWSRSSFDEARAASLLDWNNSVVRSVDMAVACLIDLATASRNLERAATDIDSCCKERKAAEENRSAWELIDTNFLAFLSHASRFFSGMEALPLLNIVSGQILVLALVEFSRSKSRNQALRAYPVSRTFIRIQSVLNVLCGIFYQFRLRKNK